MRFHQAHRRQFLAEIGRGMLICGVGYSVAQDLGLTPALADDNSADRLTFGAQERLVSLIQETPPDQILPEVVGWLRGGTPLKEIVGAAALANARAFGGEDYIGYHTFMALQPAYRMSQQLPGERGPLPVLKVLYRNAARMHATGHRTADTLHPVAADRPLSESNLAERLREAVHRGDKQTAEQVLAGSESTDATWNALVPRVHEVPDVHRVVLAHRAWDMAGLVGVDYAQTMLRQSLRYCVDAEKYRAANYGNVPQMLVRVLDDHKLLGRELGTRAADDAWIEAFTQLLFNSTAEQAGDAVGAALAEGFSADAIAEAVSLAANQLVLRDPGRSEPQPAKPVGSVHGDSIGVHASDSANAWRHIARVSNPRNAAASLIMAGYHVAADRSRLAGDGSLRPLPEHLEQISATEPTRLLAELDDAIRAQNQDRACAVVGRYCLLGYSERPVFELLLKYATSEDGALHAEKYFWTVSDEFALTRAALRSRQLVALARVTASEYGNRAAGYDEACAILGCEA